MMLQDIVQVRVVGDHRLWLRFEDGVEGEIEFEKIAGFEGVFAALKDPAVFAQVRLDTELGTIVWPGGADLDPDVLHAQVTREPIRLTKMENVRK